MIKIIFCISFRFYLGQSSIIKGTLRWIVLPCSKKRLVVKHCTHKEHTMRLALQYLPGERHRRDSPNVRPKQSLHSRRKLVAYDPYTSGFMHELDTAMMNSASCSLESTCWALSRSNMYLWERAKRRGVVNGRDAGMELNVRPEESQMWLQQTENLYL
jgi:hypothetical protein